MKDYIRTYYNKPNNLYINLMTAKYNQNKNDPQNASLMRKRKISIPLKVCPLIFQFGAIKTLRKEYKNRNISNKYLMDKNFINNYVPAMIHDLTRIPCRILVFKVYKAKLSNKHI